jgi:hypothetical protein
MIVPAEKDWRDYRSDLDQEQAHDLFAGRLKQEMLPYFRANPIERSGISQAERRRKDA